MQHFSLPQDSAGIHPSKQKRASRPIQPRPPRAAGTGARRTRVLRGARLHGQQLRSRQMLAAGAEQPASRAERRRGLRARGAAACAAVPNADASAGAAARQPQAAGRGQVGVAAAGQAQAGQAVGGAIARGEQRLRGARAGALMPWVTARRGCMPVLARAGRCPCKLPDQRRPSRAALRSGALLLRAQAPDSRCMQEACTGSQPDSPHACCAQHWGAPAAAAHCCCRRLWAGSPRAPAGRPAPRAPRCCRRPPVSRASLTVSSKPRRVSLLSARFPGMLPHPPFGSAWSQGCCVLRAARDCHGLLVGDARQDGALQARGAPAQTGTPARAGRSCRRRRRRRRRRPRRRPWPPWPRA